MPSSKGFGRPRMTDWVNDIHVGDACETLAEIPESSVHMAMCSPPYYGLRDYDAEGQIGLEDSLDEYIGELVAVGEELRRVLRPDGSWWLNLGDSYAGSGGAGGQWTDESSGSAEYAGDRGDGYNGPLNQQTTLRRKNKMLVPHRAAIALQEAGWVVRNDVTWVKPNPMPSSVKDRLNTTTEQVFHLTPEPDYWYDLDAIREPHAESTRERMGNGYRNTGEGTDKRNQENSPGTNNRGGGMNEPGIGFDEALDAAGKNPGDVFEVTTKPFPEAHFAVYPPELCEKPIKASCPPQVCADCGAPLERTFDEEHRGNNHGARDDQPRAEGDTSAANLARCPNDWTPREREFNGWTQTCDCDTDAIESGIVLDPFAGAGTTCLVAKRLGRRFVGIDLNPEYVAMAQQRVGVTVDEPERLLADEETALTAFGGEPDG
jgi:DNA modification methylase